ncbi:hypothetical protein [Streptomyces rochei]|uniref:hypothetical protein n=1 Tax=Streptomyces rochei TaxID=1928 RepID=UPI0036FBA625
MHPYEVKQGTIVVDEERNDIGTVTAVEGDTVSIKSLHPRFGSWKAPAAKVRLAKPTERVQAQLLAANARSAIRLP